jgi:hypothetical protein
MFIENITNSFLIRILFGDNEKGLGEMESDSPDPSPTGDSLSLSLSLYQRTTKNRNK